MIKFYINVMFNAGMARLDIIDEGKILPLLGLEVERTEIKSILQKAAERKGLDLEEAAKLLATEDSGDLELLFTAAKKVKDEIYGPRLVLFAPLYCSSFCTNDCEYCSFHVRNQAPRKKLSLGEVREQTEILEDMGHKRLLLEFGEDPEQAPIDYVVDVINAIYDTKKGKGEIRRVNVNIAATTVENYKKLKEAGIGTYQLFQETYHRPTYARMHCGPKADYERQLTAMGRAFEAGLDDLGIGVLFGLYDYRYEVLALLQYAKFMDKVFGVGPHTISVPRFCPASTVQMSLPHRVGDRDFLKLIAVLRLAVPYTGIIVSTRETLEIRRQAFAIGISQASAASKTEPGGYKQDEEKTAGQFILNDHRGLDEVVRDICRLGYLPSFCTACYRRGRTGDVFMELAKSGKIHNLCQPNALLTFKEYLLDYASPETKRAGEETIAKQIELIESPVIKIELEKRMERLEQEERDLYF